MATASMTRLSTACGKGLWTAAPSTMVLGYVAAPRSLLSARVVRVATILFPLTRMRCRRAATTTSTNVAMLDADRLTTRQAAARSFGHPARASEQAGGRMFLSPVPTMTAILRAVRESSLIPLQRLVVMTAASLSDPRTGVIPPQYRPTQDDLTRYTGLSRATVYRVVREVDDAGWIVRDRVSSRAPRIAAVLIPGQSHTETEQSHAETEADQDQSHTETPPSHTETEQSHTETDTVLHGPSGPTGQNTSALFDVPPGKTTPPAKTPPTDPADFVAFWSAYPRKVDKGHARKAWATATKNGTDPAAITAAAEAYSGQCARNRTETRFIPHPATWLNGERWADQPEALAPSGLIEHDGLRLKPETVANMQRREHFAAMDAASERPAIERPAS